MQLALLAVHGRPQTALRLMSGYDDPGSTPDAGACGARVLLEPVNRDHLLTQLAAALDGNGVAKL